MFQWIGLSLGGIIVSYAVVSVVCNKAKRLQVIDVPNERSCHTRPTPRGGGLGIVAATLLGGWLYALLSSLEQWQMLLTYTAAAGAIATISWLDDRRAQPYWLRLTVHSLGAVLAILSIGFWQDVHLPLIGEIHLGWFGLPVTFVWIVGLTNAYNFMDGIDGLAGGQAVVAGFGWSILGALTGHPLVSVLGLLLAASSLGFLGHNWPPARIFMGDVGSTFLGYTFAVLPLMFGLSGEGQYSIWAPLVGIVLVWPFVFDAAFTLCRRVRNGENILVAHRSHFYQRLVTANCSHVYVDLLYIALAVAGLVVAVAWLAGQTVEAALGVFLLPLLAIALGGFVLYKEKKNVVSTQAATGDLGLDPGS